MAVPILPIPAIVVDIKRLIAAPQGQADLEQGLYARMLDPRIAIIPGMRITPLHPSHHCRRNIILVIGDVRIKMTPMLIVMSNHFPTIMTATIVEVRVPMSIDMSPLRITRLGIIPAEGPFHGWRNVLLPVLRERWTAGGQQQ